jgi:putative flippase GtrA
MIGPGMPAPVRQLFVYAAIGVSLILLDLAVFELLSTVVRLPWLAKLISVSITVVLSYLLNARLTFRSRVTVAAFRIFLVLYSVSIGLNVAVFQGLTQWLGVLDSIAVLVASMASALFNFTTIRRVVFTDHTVDENGKDRSSKSEILRLEADVRE